MSNIKAFTASGVEVSVAIDVKNIDYCPICHKGVEPINLNNYLIGSKSNILQRIYRCPRNQCGRVFLANYSQSRNNTYYFSNLEPREHEEPLLPELLKENYPDFCEIYNQAMVADEINLKEIAGIGLRKSLEFLIKGFIIKNLKSDNNIENKTETIDKVKKLFLGACIKEYIDDSIIKRRAERAVWLGNDETHFFRKWPEKDLTDLKKLLEITISSIQTHLLDEKYQKEMEEPR